MKNLHSHSAVVMAVSSQKAFGAVSPCSKSPRLDTARRTKPMKSFLHSQDGASKGAALMIVLAFVVLLTGLSLAYMSRTTTDRQLAQSSYNDTSADLLGRTALDTVVNDFKQEIVNHPTVTPAAPFYI